MSPVTASHHEFGKAICDALGLKCVTRLQITLGVNQATEVVATTSILTGNEIAEVVRRFELNPVERPLDEAAPGNAQVGDHDAT